MAGAAAAGRPVLLWGFMGTGKSSVGPLVAAALGRPFLDLDAEIERAAGRTVAELFAREGEAAFRDRERRALLAALERADAVVALGGGALCSDEALARARAAGPLVVLRASLPEILRRVGDAADRPLLGGGAAAAAAAAELLAARARYYAAADVTVDTDGRTPAAVAHEVLTWLRGEAVRPGHVVPVELGARRYEVVVTRGFAGLEPLLGPPGAGLAVVTDEHVAAAQLPALRAALAAAGRTAEIVTVAAGEASKSLAVAERVLADFVRAGLDRGATVVGCGGGVVTDLAGFAASVFLRGVEWVAVPTSLLAQVDASVGGKTGVNLLGKNLVGTFHQPRGCYVNLETLATLPAAELRAGLAEVVKHALLADPGLLQHLEAHAEQARAGDLDVLAPCVVRSVAIKAGVVARDEREAGERVRLNLGHTVGHAIEAASGFTVRHGEAVGLGLLAALRVSARRGYCDAGLEARVAALLGRLGLDTALDRWLRPEVLAGCAVDKKRQGAAIRFVAVEDVGRTRILGVSLSELSADLLPGANR